MEGGWERRKASGGGGGVRCRGCECVEGVFGVGCCFFCFGGGGGEVGRGARGHILVR